MKEFKKDKYVFAATPSIIDIGEKARQVREKQISFMIKELFLYKVFIKDLAGMTPSYRDRNIILNIAFYIIEDIDIYEILQKKRELPFNLIGKRTRVSRAFLELWQNYILAYIILLSNPNYKMIQDYIKIADQDTSTLIIPREDKDKIYRGIALKVSKKSSIILTGSGEFVKVKIDDESLVGKETSGKEKRGLKHYRIHIAIAMVLIIFASIAVYQQYNKQSSIIVIETSSQIKMDINKFNKIIYTYSPTDKGKKLIETVDPLDKHVDNVIEETLKYANENQMVPKDGILITVSGEPLRYGILEKTGQYIVDNNIKLTINNAGSEHKLYESTIKQKEDKDENK